jgi:hypothetical protein
MPFYQNVIDEECRDHLSVLDMKAAITFSIPACKNRTDNMQAGNYEPYDLSANPNLTLNYAYDPLLKGYSPLVINVSGATPAATLAAEVVAALNANATFADYFTAEIRTVLNGNLVVGNTVVIKGKRPKVGFRAYVSNSSAETKLRFNKYAPVVELPTLFDRHTIANRFTYPNGMALLIKLDTSNSVDQAIITQAGLDYTTVRGDWQFLAGRNPAYTFKKQTVDGSDRVTQVIEYPAGAVVGDLAMQTKYTYTSANKNPDTVVELPYILTSGDLITSP